MSSNNNNKDAEVFRHLIADEAGLIHIQVLDASVPCPIDGPTQDTPGRLCGHTPSAVPGTQSSSMSGPPSSLLHEPERVGAETPIPGATLCQVCAHASGEHILDWPIDEHSAFHGLPTPLREGKMPFTVMALPDAFDAPVGPSVSAAPRTLMTKAAEAAATVMDDLNNNKVGKRERNRRRRRNFNVLKKTHDKVCWRCTRRDAYNDRLSPLSMRPGQIHGVLADIPPLDSSEAEGEGLGSRFDLGSDEPWWALAPVPFKLPGVKAKDNGKGKEKEKDAGPSS
ncbi:MAG: hypothetical protein STHCBS139747_007398 [Sporothrix thermara]